MPPNPVWVEIPRTDGDEKLWPKNTTRIVDRSGEVNFMRPVPLDESLCLHWRKLVGLKVAEALGMPSKYSILHFMLLSSLVLHRRACVCSQRVPERVPDV